MLETLKRLVLGEPSTPSTPAAADPAAELAHIEQVIRDTEADLQEAREAVEHFREQLAVVDARTLLDREDTGDAADAGSWVQELIEAQEDFARLSAALPHLETQRDEAQRALKRHQLATYLDLIDQQKREYADLATVLNSQLSSAADTAARMTGLAEAIETGRSRAYGLQVETAGVPTGISFTPLDVLVEFRKALAKARTRSLATTATPTPIVPVVARFAPGVAISATFASDGHTWTITPTTEGTCQHKVGNKAGSCGDPAAYRATYQPPGERLRSWIFCQSHGTHWQVQHITLPAAAAAERG
jgi:hypothetical protein